MTEIAPYRITYRKATPIADGETRYHVFLDGEKVGWVQRWANSGAGHEDWSFFAHVEDSLQGKRLATEPQRGVAVEEGLSRLSNFHLGRIQRLDLDQDSETYLQDVFTYLDRDRLKATWEDLTDKRYGLGAYA